MSAAPIVCPHCYKTIHTPNVEAGGLVRCDACGHAFPLGGIPQGSAAPPPFKPLPVFQPGAVASAHAPGGKYQPAYPPATGPQNPGNPGLVACGVVVALGFFGLL